MNSEAYEILALGARYWFALLGAVIIFRAWRLTVKDNRHAKVLRDWTPETGCIGEFLILSGKGGARRGARYPVLRECILGSGRACDIRLNAPGVLKRHAHLEIREGGLLAAAMPGAQISANGEPSRASLLLQDGDTLFVEGVQLRLTLYDTEAAQEEPPFEQIDFEAFEGAEDEPLSAQEAEFLRSMSRQKTRKP